MTTVNMSPAKLDVVLYAGDDYSEMLVIVPKDSEGTPVDLTGVTARCQARRRGTVVDATVTVTDSITVALSSEQTASMSPSSWPFDLEWTRGGEVQTLLYGTIKVLPQVTA